jgi:hypothetical protein
MSHHLLFLAVIWIGFAGLVATVASAGSGERAVGAVATGGVFAATIGSLLVFLA